jgi:hypothetical protein
MSEAGIGSTKGRLQQNGLLQRNGLFLLPEEQPVLFPQSTGVLLRGVRHAGQIRRRCGLGTAGALGGLNAGGRLVFLVGCGPALLNADGGSRDH